MTVRPATYADSIFLAKNLRHEDRQEIRASIGVSALVALEGSRELSPSPRTIQLRDKPCAMFGCVPVQVGSAMLGTVWLMGSDEIRIFSRLFLRHSRRWADINAMGCDATLNVVDYRNRVHIRWLRWLGYKFLRVIPDYGVQRRPFIEFARIEDVQRTSHSATARSCSLNGSDRPAAADQSEGPGEVPAGSV